MNDLAKSLIFLGVVLIGAGLLVTFFAKIPGFGKLPGDIYIKKENFSFYFPVMTCLVVSVLLTLFMMFFGKR